MIVSKFGGLDWGRGNWTYKNRWYWGSASGLLKGDSFGWNIGYFTGTVILDDGTVLKVKDFFGFVEDVLNWW